MQEKLFWVAAGETVLSVVGSVLGATFAAGIWLAVAHSYRTEKRRIVAEVARRLKASDITEASDAVQATDLMRKVAKEVATWCLGGGMACLVTEPALTALAGERGCGRTSLTACAAQCCWWLWPA